VFFDQPAPLAPQLRGVGVCALGAPGHQQRGRREPGRQRRPDRFPWDAVPRAANQQQRGDRLTGADRCLPGSLGEELTRLPPGDRPGPGGDGTLAHAADHVEVDVRLPGALDPGLDEPDLCGEGPQFVLGVGEQVTPPAVHDPPAVRHLGAEIEVIDVHGHG
jgi:hypothetical protein